MITEGYLGLHYHGRRGGRDPALLDVAQDYALKIIFDSDLYSLGLTFKGGTALRKYRVGNAGRFSTDLDFAADERGVGELLLETLDNSNLFDVGFSISDVQEDRRGSLSVDTPLGSPQIKSKVEISPRPQWLSPEWLDPIPMPVHKGYEFTPTRSLVMVLEEALAEKLAAFRRRGLVRDLYDLALFHSRPFDEDLVRRLTFLKIYCDVVEDGLGTPPFDPRTDILEAKGPSDFSPEDIGLLTSDVDIPTWLIKLQSRYGFLERVTDEEITLAKCEKRNAIEIQRIIKGLETP